MRDGWGNRRRLASVRMRGRAMQGRGDGGEESDGLAYLSLWQNRDSKASPQRHRGTKENFLEYITTQFGKEPNISWILYPASGK